jgi:predicted nucleic acid-binding protein
VLIFLDTELLWLLVHPRGGPKTDALNAILSKRLAQRDELAVAEVCDYEARRELLRKGAARQLTSLDAFIDTLRFVPIDSTAMRLAAELWAELRRSGRPTAADGTLDCDVILGAQARQYEDHVVATENLRHLGRVCNATHWRDL